MVVVNNSRPEIIERRYERVTEDSSGWAVALLILLALVVLGLLFWWRGHGIVPAAPAAPSTNVNVSLPSSPGTAGPDSSVPGNANSAAGSGSAGAAGTGSVDNASTGSAGGSAGTPASQ